MTAMATREPRRDETRQRILDIAKDLFGRDGFDGTSVKQVAAAAGLSDAALYYHFRSKREILQAIWNLPMGGGIEGVRPNGPFSQPRLDEIVDAVVDFYAGNDALLRLMAREILAGDQTANALRRDQQAVLRKTLYDHFATAFDAPQADLRSRAVAQLLSGALILYQLREGAEFARAVTGTDFREGLKRRAGKLAALPAAS
jgi:AcrR family transcriptional regulator